MDWAEEPGQAGYFKYQSDFDLLVVVSDKKLAKQLERWDKIEEKIEKNGQVKTPVCIITHSIQYVNQMLPEGHTFSRILSGRESCFIIPGTLN